MTPKRGLSLAYTGRSSTRIDKITSFPMMEGRLWAWEGVEALDEALSEAEGEEGANAPSTGMNDVLNALMTKNSFTVAFCTSVLVYTDCVR